MRIPHGSVQDEFRLSVYPNPANNYCNLEFLLPESAEIDITIVDMLGKTVSNLQHGFISAFLEITVIILRIELE
jgi:hypothetical protein